MNGAMAYVGSGTGDWVTETTYKYVGSGAGDLTIVGQKPRNLLWLWILLGVLAIVALVFLFWPTSATTTTMSPVFPVMTTPAPESKTCLFWGDPHLVSFDGARPSFYGDGEFWIVKNDQVHIQGRYMGTKYTFGLAAAQKVAIGGPFLNNHVIEIEPMESKYGGRIMVDRQPVLGEFGLYVVDNNLATIQYNGVGELIDEATSQWTTRAVHLNLPQGIHMTVFRWGNYLDLKIQMTRLPDGQDGSCGNFNGEAADDTTAAIFSRIGPRVPSAEMMFSSTADVSMTMEEAKMLQTQCPQNTHSEASALCRQKLPSGTTAENTACAFDVCFGMNEHALRSAKTYATQEDLQAAHMD